MHYFYNQGWSWLTMGCVTDSLVAFSGGQCTVGNKTVWMFGSFGLCIEYIFLFNG